MYVVTVYIIPSSINPIQTNSGIDHDGLGIDFFDIPMDGIQEADELDEYLGQAIEKVKDPIAWCGITKKSIHNSWKWCLITLVFWVSLNFCCPNIVF